MEDLFSEPRREPVQIDKVYVKRASGWSWGGGMSGGPSVDPGEVLDFPATSMDEPLIRGRYVVPLPPDAQPVTCDCGRTFLDKDSLKVHRGRTHGERGGA
jgi:hypothetical protein